MSPNGLSSPKYNLGPLLGAGGMAEVYQATVRGAEGFSRTVAVKRIRPELSRNDRFVELLVAEARLTALLNHPNIVSVIDFDRDAEGRLFLAMELVAGRDLRQLMDTGPLPYSLIVHLATEMLRGLGHAHDLTLEGRPLGLVHRDVSPHNVLVSWEGAVKVSDFGIAKASSAAGPSGIMRGKPSYMSPEQASLQPLDRRADLYSVGAVMYRLISGRVPHVGDSPAQVVSKLLHAPIAPIHELRSDVPRDLALVTMRLLARDRDRRYPSHVEAIEHLRSCADAPSHGQDELAVLLARRFPDEAPARRVPVPAPAPAPRRPGHGSVGNRSGQTAAMGTVRPIALAETDQTRTLPPRPDAPPQPDETRTLPPRPNAASAAPASSPVSAGVRIPSMSVVPMGTIGVASAAAKPGTILSTGAAVGVGPAAIPVADRALRVGTIDAPDAAPAASLGVVSGDISDHGVEGVVSGVVDGGRASGSVRSVLVTSESEPSEIVADRAPASDRGRTAMVTIPPVATLEAPMVTQAGTPMSRVPVVVLALGVVAAVVVAAVLLM